jgi:hypothetical protein
MIKLYNSNKEALEQLLSCGYTCTGGPLENNVAFRHLCKQYEIVLPPLEGFEYRKTNNGG